MQDEDAIGGSKPGTDDNGVERLSATQEVRVVHFDAWQGEKLQCSFSSSPTCRRLQLRSLGEAQGTETIEVALLDTFPCACANLSCSPAACCDVGASEKLDYFTPTPNPLLLFSFVTANAYYPLPAKELKCHVLSVVVICRVIQQGVSISFDHGWLTIRLVALYTATGCFVAVGGVPWMKITILFIVV